MTTSLRTRYPLALKSDGFAKRHLRDTCLRELAKPGDNLISLPVPRPDGDNTVGELATYDATRQVVVEDNNLLETEIRAAIRAAATREYHEYH